MYNQQYLPFSTDTLTSQMFQVSPGNLHFQINSALYPPLQNYLQFIGSIAIDEIQKKSGINQLRIFLFNQMSVNGYNNNDFLLLVKSIAQFAEMQMAKGNFRDVQSAIMDGAIKITEFCCAGNLITFPQLANCINPQVYQAAQSTLQLLQQYSADMTIFQQRQNTNQQQGFAPQQQWNQQPVQQSNWQQPPQSPQYPQPMQRPQQGGNFYSAPLNTSNGTLFNNGNNQQTPFNNPQNTAPQSLYLFKESEPRQQITPIQQMPAVVENVFAKNIQDANQNQANLPNELIQRVNSLGLIGELKSANEPGVVWKPSEKYPFTIAYDEDAYELYYLVEQDGSMKPFLQPLTQEKIMERSKHFKPNFIQMDTAGCAQRTNNFMEGIRNSNAIVSRETTLADEALVKNADNDHLEIDMLSGGNSCILTISDEEVWKYGDIELVAMKKSKTKVSGYSTSACVASTFVSQYDPKPLADLLLKTSNFYGAVSVLKDAIAAAARNDFTYGDLTVINYFNARLTERLNRFVQKQLALDISISSFLESSVELIDHIEKRQHEKFSNPLRASQKIIIVDSCNYATGEFEEDYIQGYAPADYKDKSFITFFYHGDFFVSVNLFSTDFKINLKKQGYSVAVYEEQSPILNNLAKYIFTEEDARDARFTRHLIKTLDMVIFEVNQSVIDSETFLVNI